MKKIIDKEQYYLTCLAEECAETIQRISKIFRFGLDSAHPKYGSVPSRTLLAEECGDILGVIDELIALGTIDETVLAEHRVNKPARIEKYREEFEYNGQHN